MNKRVTVVGSSNTDMVVKTPDLPSPGETILGGEFVVAAGGKGANQAVAAARLGADVNFVAKLGKDVLGDQAMAGFREEGINTEFVLRDESVPSGVALIMVDSQGENMISVASGANSQLHPPDVTSAEEAIRSSSVVLLQLETPMDTVETAARLARSHGVTVILNPAPAQPLWERLLCNVSVLTPNASETELLTGVRPDDSDRARQAAAMLRSKGVESVVITLGKKGACLLTSDGFEVFESHSVTAVDATAAGDAFNGALAYMMSSGAGLPEAIRFATRVAALSVTRLGAQPSLPTLAEVEGFFGPTNS
jgi:ribokinase